jgi:hypothetical protein
MMPTMIAQIFRLQAILRRQAERAKWADVLPRGVTLADLVDGGLVGHVSNVEVLVQVGAPALAQSTADKERSKPFYPLGMEYLALPETAPLTARACCPIILDLRWTKSFEDFFKCSTQLALCLDLIRGFTPLIRKLDRVGVSPGADPDLNRGYHARA